MKIVRLDAALKNVCPIHGVSIGRWANRLTWRIDFKDEATPEQRVAARAVMDAFDPQAPENNQIPKTPIEQLLDKLVTKGVLTKQDALELRASQ